MMTKEALCKQTDVFLLDLDGTVYLGEKPIGNAAATLQTLRERGKRLVFLTNNSSKTQEEYRGKLLRIGLWGEGDLVYTSAMAAASYLQKHAAGQPVYLVGTAAVREEFARFGVRLEEEAPALCVLAYDTELTFAKLERLDRFLREGKYFIATHPDDVCPTESGTAPDVGSFLALLERSSGRRPDLIVGKPYTAMGEELARLTGVPREKMCMVGDRMHTDVRFAANNGMKSVLVLSGETTRETMRRFPDVPDLVLENIDEIL